MGRTPRLIFHGALPQTPQGGHPLDPIRKKDREISVFFNAIKFIPRRNEVSVNGFKGI